MLKKFTHVFVAFAVILSMTMISVAATFETHQVFSTQALHELEKNMGIETKPDSEVFTVTANDDAVGFYYKETQDTLSFTPLSTYALHNPQTELIPIDDGFQVETIVVESDSYSDNGLGISLPTNWTIDYARDNNGNVSNGSLGIYDELGTAHAASGLPTVLDCMGNSVDAHFNLVGDKIVVEIESDQNTVYPLQINYGIYALNPARGVTDYFRYAGFDRVYIGSLTLGPRYFDEGSSLLCENAWAAVYKLFFPYSSYWTTSTQTKSMYNQYNCHATFAKTKNDWNLEPWRPVVSWSDMIWHTCNPE